MTRRRNSLFMIPILLATISFVGSLVGIRKPLSVEAQNETNLSLDIRTSERKYLKFEPIPLEFKMTNESLSEVKWNGDLDFSTDVILIISTPNGTQKLWNGAERSVGFRDAGPQFSRAASSKTVKRLINEEFASELFGQAGKYTLTVQFKYRESSSGEVVVKSVTSNTITFDIEEPNGRNLLAHQFLTSVLRPVLKGINVNEKLLRRQYFATQFGDTAYARYNGYELGKLYVNDGQYQNAENEFYKISDIDFFYARQVDLELDNLAIKLQRPYTRTKRPPVTGTPPVPRPIPSPNISAIPIAPIPPPIAIPISTPMGIIMNGTGC